MSTIRIVETCRDLRFSKRTWSPLQLSMIRVALTAEQRRIQGYSFGAAPTIKAYTETTWEIIVPRAWGYQCLQQGKLESWSARERKMVSCECPTVPSLTLRDQEWNRQRVSWNHQGPFALTLQSFQDDICRRALHCLQSPPYSVLLNIGCGQGKTIMALYLAGQLRVKTLVIVQDSFLLNQWIERIQTCYPELRVGRLQQDKNDLDDTDITIGMAQTVVSRYMGQTERFQSVGLLILDECHRMASPLFSQVMKTCMAPHVIGCSATPERQDGLHQLLQWYIGPEVKSTVSNELIPVTVIGCTFPSWQSVQVTVNASGLPNVVQLISDLSTLDIRNRFLFEWIQCMHRDPHRVVIVLSHRRQQLDWFHEQCRTVGINDVGFYIGGMKQAKLDETAKNARIILATYQMAQQALDIPRLNTLVMGTPMKDMRQSIGRITRLSTQSPVPALVIDVVDSKLPTCMKHSQQRRKLYRQRQYRVIPYDQTTVPMDFVVPIEPGPDRSDEEEDVDSESDTEDNEDSDQKEDADHGGDTERRDKIISSKRHKPNPFLP